MSWALFLVALAPVAAIIYVVWAYRKRTAARATASSERFAQIFNPSAQRSASTHVTTGGVQAGGPLGAISGVSAATRVPSSYTKRTTFLGVRHNQLFERLAAGLPDHAIFAHVSLAAVIELTGLPEGREREQRLRALAQQTVHCVVCSKSFEVVAVVDLESGHTADTRFRAECLKAAGVRYLLWNPLELPRNHEVGALITGV